jgi:RimJ/RimL family protein N-acetyltransferase
VLTPQRAGCVTEAQAHDDVDPSAAAAAPRRGGFRHRLTDEEGGGHLGYHVVYPWQGQGHATAMLLEGLERARAVGIERFLLTVAPDNEASRKVVERHGGIADGLNHEAEMRFWLDTPASIDMR